MVETELKKILPLPELKVLREDFASQALTDQVISSLEKGRPDLLALLLEQESASRQANYYKAADKFIRHLLSGSPVRYSSFGGYLGMLDTISELSRRLRKAYGFTDIGISGQPLSKNPNGPLPPLIHIELDQYSINIGLTQPVADGALNAAYLQRPDLWYVTAEQVRRRLRLYDVSNEFHQLFRELVSNEEAQNLNTVASYLQAEAYRRVTAMCNVSLESDR
jgi:hypothetical protein